MKQVLFFLLVLLPVATQAQPVGVQSPQQPSATAQADAAAVQGSRILTFLASQVETDQQRLADMQKQIVEADRGASADKVTVAGLQKQIVNMEHEADLNKNTIADLTKKLNAIAVSSDKEEH